MALTDKIKAIANAIRGKTGNSNPMTLEQMAVEINNLETEMSQVYILEDEAGNEVVAVLVGNEAPFNATAEDIRAGKRAATNDGVVIGTLEV